MADSPAVDGGQCVHSVTTNQRGKPRPQGPACDRGAVERQPDDGKFFVYLPAVHSQRVP